MTEHDAVVIGVDYGTLSGRAVVVRVSDRRMSANAKRSTRAYPKWRKRARCKSCEASMIRKP